MDDCDLAVVVVVGVILDDGGSGVMEVLPEIDDTGCCTVSTFAFLKYWESEVDELVLSLFCCVGSVFVLSQ